METEAEHAVVFRRRLLTTVASTGVLALAGCTTGSDDATTGTPTTGESDDGTTGLDLREANVTAVGIEQVEDGVRFDMTLYHDDDGEDGYANWWQVERLDGTQLGRRDLAHAHGTREFTRSATVDVPDGVSCVVVRGHDQTHGYGGQVMLVSLDDGATKAVQQGSEPQSFEESDCP